MQKDEEIPENAAAEEISDSDLDEVQGGNWAHQAQKTLSSTQKKFHNTAMTIIKNI